MGVTYTEGPEEPDTDREKTPDHMTVNTPPAQAPVKDVLPDHMTVVSPPAQSPTTGVTYTDGGASPGSRSTIVTHYYLLQESLGRFLTENSSGFILLENSA